MSNGISFQTQQQLNNLERSLQPVPVAPRQSNNTWTPEQVEQERVRLQAQQQMAPMSHQQFKVIEAKKLEEDALREARMARDSGGYVSPEQQKMNEFKARMNGGFNSLFGFGK